MVRWWQCHTNATKAVWLSTLLWFFAGALQHGHPAVPAGLLPLLSVPAITPPAPPLARRERVRFLADLEKDGWELMEAVRVRTGFVLQAYLPPWPAGDPAVQYRLASLWWDA